MKSGVSENSEVNEYSGAVILLQSQSSIHGDGRRTRSPLGVKEGEDAGSTGGILHTGPAGRQTSQRVLQRSRITIPFQVLASRSEERRVGKEWRSRVGREHGK